MSAVLQLEIRPAKLDDCKAMCSLLNEIIVIGGTTAFETELTSNEVDDKFISGNNCISCLVAEQNGLILGFQSLSCHPKLDIGWADIATFARSEPKLRGVGTALFKRTIQFSVDNKIDFINATIRSDNRSGLSYYAKMGFSNYSVAEGVPLHSGKRVDRISKRYCVTAE